MSKISWNPAEFHSWYECQDMSKKVRALADLTSEQKKRYREWKTFEGFYLAAELNVVPSSVAVCNPPFPDIVCSLDRQIQFFELGEVVMEKVARDASIAAKQGGCPGGFVSTTEPLLNVFRSKCDKIYQTDGKLLHLLLHFNVGHQYPIGYSIGGCTLRNLLAPNEFEKSQFTSVYVYDSWEKSVLEILSRS